MYEMHKRSSPYMMHYKEFILVHGVYHKGHFVCTPVWFMST